MKRNAIRSHESLVYVTPEGTVHRVTALWPAGHGKYRVRFFWNEGGAAGDPREIDVPLHALREPWDDYSARIITHCPSPNLPMGGNERAAGVCPVCGRIPKEAT